MEHRLTRHTQHAESNRNRYHARDPDMHKTKMGNRWYFVRKPPIVMDSRTTLVHSTVATAANAHHSQALEDLLHGNETRVRGDACTGLAWVRRRVARCIRPAPWLDQFECPELCGACAPCTEVLIRNDQDALSWPGEECQYLFGTLASGNLLLVKRQLLQT